MGIGTAVGGIAGAVGSIGGAAIQSNAAGNAASTQATAANYAANLQAQEAQNSLGFQESEYNNAQTEAAPYLQTGYSAEANLANLLGILPPGTNAQSPINGLTSPNAFGVPAATGEPTSILSQDPNSVNTGAPPRFNAAGAPLNGNTVLGGQVSETGPAAAIPSATQPAGAPSAVNAPGVTPAQSVNLQSLVNPSLGATGSLSQPWTGSFTAPTAAEAAATPGEQFELQQGLSALNNSAAAQGNLLSGGNLKALEQYANNAASTNYQQAYNNAYNNYSTAYNQFEQGQTNQFNRLASLAGVGQTTAQQLGQTGQAAANNVSSTLANAGAQIGQNINNAGAATASGYVGQGNALAGGLSGATGSLSQTLALGQILGLGNSFTQTPYSTVATNPFVGPAINSGQFTTNTDLGDAGVLVNPYQ